MLTNIATLELKGGCRIAGAGSVQQGPAQPAAASPPPLYISGGVFAPWSGSLASKGASARPWFRALFAEDVVPVVPVVVELVVLGQGPAARRHGLLDGDLNGGLDLVEGDRRGGRLGLVLVE